MPGEEKVFVFDCVLGEDSTQRDVYERAARPIVQDMLEGFNASIFVYGMRYHAPKINVGRGMGRSFSCFYVFLYLVLPVSATVF
jgi:hypothetical protein